MFRFLVICGCLLAVAQAGVVSGGLLATPGVAVQQTVPLSAAVAVPTLTATTSNFVRGPVATVAGPSVLAPGLLATGHGVAGLGLGTVGLNGLALNGLTGLNGLALGGNLGLGLGAVRLL